VDGSHIRTLLLTFFFRQMPELIRRGRIFIAQPPLYQLIRGKTSRYVLNEKVMADTLTEVGLEHSTLEVRDPSRTDPKTGIAPVQKRIEGESLKRTARALRRLAELVTIAERRGVRFADLLTTRDRDPEGRERLPSHRVSWVGGGVAHDEYAWSAGDAEAIAAKHNLRTEEPVENGQETPVVDHRVPGAIRELHENRELDRVFVDLTGVGLDIADWALVQEESAAGEKLPARFAWVITGSLPAKAAPDEAAGDAGADGQDEPEGAARKPAPKNS
jgi:DNA gyrase subunit B